MEDAPRTFEVAGRAAAPGLVAATARATLEVRESGAPPAGDDAWIALPLDAARLRLDVPPAVAAPSPVLAWRATAPGRPTAGARPHGAIEIERGAPTGNMFRVLAETDRVAAALVALTAGRAVDAGPESERWWIALAGTGLVFLQDGSTLPVAPGGGAIVPAGEPARLWCRGPEELHVLVLQPQGAPVARRTLKSEVERRRAGGE